MDVDIEKLIKELNTIEQAKTAEITHCCGMPLNWKNVGGIDHKFFGSYCTNCESSYAKRDTSKIYYVQKKDSLFVCGRCEFPLATIEIIHPVDSYSIKERALIEDVPFCLECEEKPKELSNCISKDLWQKYQELNRK